VVIFVDYQCGYCRSVEKLLRRRIEEGQDKDLQVAFKHHPLVSHDWSRRASRVGVCAYNQSNEAFWMFTSYVFDHQESINAANLDAKVEEFVRNTPALNPDSLSACLHSGVPEMAILRDENSGFLAGVRVVPTLFVDGDRFVGEPDEGRFSRLLDQREAIAEEALPRKTRRH